MIVWCMHVSIDVWILISFGVAVLSFELCSFYYTRIKLWRI